MAKKKRIEVKDHWRHQLTQVRCWISGFTAGRHVPGTLATSIPGEAVIHQIILAIDEAEST